MMSRLNEILDQCTQPHSAEYNSWHKVPAELLNELQATLTMIGGTSGDVKTYSMNRERVTVFKYNDEIVMVFTDDGATYIPIDRVRRILSEM